MLGQFYKSPQSKLGGGVKNIHGLPLDGVRNHPYILPGKLRLQATDEEVKNRPQNKAILFSADPRIAQPIIIIGIVNKITLRLPKYPPSQPPNVATNTPHMKPIEPNQAPICSVNKRFSLVIFAFCNGGKAIVE